MSKSMWALLVIVKLVLFLTITLIVGGVSGLLAVMSVVGYPLSIVGGLLLLFTYLRRCEVGAAIDPSEAADRISAKIKADKEAAEKDFVQMWDDAFEWLTAYDEYRRLMAWADRETNEKIVRQITTLAVQEWVYANQKCATIGARYANAGSADVGIPAPWKESNENSKQLVR